MENIDEEFHTAKFEEEDLLRKLDGEYLGQILKLQIMHQGTKLTVACLPIRC